MAKAWVEESVQAPIGEFTKWGAIQKICQDNYGMCRTSESLRCAWSRIAKECQNFINTRLKIEAEHINEDVTEDEIDALALESYRRKTGKNTNGVFHYGAPFKYYATAKYLAKQPRFIEERSMSQDCSTINNALSNVNNNSSATLTTPNTSTQNANINPNKTSSQRLGADPPISSPFPLGLSDKEALNSGKSGPSVQLDSPSPPRHLDLEDPTKGRLRLEDLPEFRNIGDKSAVLRAKGRLAIDLNGGDILGRKREENLNKRRDEDANDREEDFRLLQMLPRGSAEYMEIMQDIMKERRLRARERLARKELVVLDLERDVRRKRSVRDPKEKS